MRFLKRDTRLIICAAGAGYGLRTTLDLLGFTNYDQHPVVTLVVGIVQIIAVIVLLVIAFTDPRERRTPVAGATSATQGPSLASLTDWVNQVVTSEHAPTGRIFVINPDELQRIRPFQEFGTRPSPLPFLIRLCRHSWHADGPPNPHGVNLTDPPHVCMENIYAHGDRCRCDCGATAKYELAPDVEGVTKKMFEDPS
jgi:hypothetical protein